MELKCTEFMDLIETPFYIDKTMLIKQILSGKIKNRLITMPPGFMKSANM